MKKNNKRECSKKPILTVYASLQFPEATTKNLTYSKSTCDDSLFGTSEPSFAETCSESDCLVHVVWSVSSFSKDCGGVENWFGASDFFSSVTTLQKAHQLIA